MPLPWKKVKKSSISQLVKEHVNSQSGSPLMVETGFPTSLVDLVVKNRGRFKKPSKKKKLPPIEDSLFPLSPLLSAPPPPSPVTLSSSSQSMIGDEVAPLIREGEGLQHSSNKMKKSCNFRQHQEGWSNGGVTMNQGLVAILKMFLVAVLVLGMNNLVFGVTLSAFLLFFLEYLGERLYGFFAGVQRRISFMTQGIWEILRTKVVVEEEDCVFKAPLQSQKLSMDGLSDFGCQSQEIEVVQETYVEDSQCVGEKIEEYVWDGKTECLWVDVMEKGDESRYDLRDSKEKKSHRAKMKSKMKKLVPKKFRKKKVSTLESHMLLDEIDYVVKGRKETEGSSEQNMELTSVASTIDELTEIVEVVDSAGGESSEGVTDDSVVESAKVTIVEGDDMTEKGHNSMYIALVFVVLVGLIGGRVLALVFTLICCLMLKRGQGIGRFTKLPVIRSFAKKSSLNFLT